MTKLSVNLNKVALLRNARSYGIPDVLKAARTCIDAGAHGITVHPRPDQRHITRGDVVDLAALVEEHTDVEYNIEGNPFEGEYMDLVSKVRPTQATLVPDAPQQSTSDHGWDFALDGERLVPVIERLHDLPVRVSLFVDPSPPQMTQAAAAGADRVELYTESYATAFRDAKYESVLEQFAETAAAAHSCQLGVNAGHDLNPQNLGPFLVKIPQILEVSIGHELVAVALWLGLTATVKQYLDVISASPQRLQ